MENKENRINEMFKSAREQEPQLSYEEVSKRFMTSRISTITASNTRLEWLTGLTLVVLGAGFLSWTFFSEKKEPHYSISYAAEEAIEVVEEEHVIRREYSDIPPQSPSQIQPVEITEMPVAKDLEPVQKLQWQPEFLPEKELQAEKPKQPGEELPEIYPFPKLTPEEKEENQKNKAKMLKHFTKGRNYQKHGLAESIDEKKYVTIPAGEMEWGDGTLQMESYRMQYTEVSVLEYRTFLFDLLIQDRKDEFLLAKPDQNQWVNRLGKWAEPMTNLYFSHEAYDNYPINNISREGAELYCEWLNEEIQKRYQIETHPVRLPTQEEWIYAASAGGAQFPYPWGGPYCRNAKGCYLANFKPGPDTSAECVGAQTLDGIYTDSLEVDSYSADGGFFTVPVQSYAPNQFGLYCMSGNVAEMVYFGSDRSQVGTKGGSWGDDSQFIQINGKDPYRGKTEASLFVGFRVLVKP
ncbi:SUMF1/EgtB/PvdO family nonheme iron enzyme [bacterium SCSIO 12741]|nr:SUMF1/EgtB/PvdO family nonheme iron enzyme [bacterium SCSIO 12741]